MASKKKSKKVNTTPRSEAFGAYIKGLRDAEGGSLRSVAARLGISFPHLGRMERGGVQKPPSIHVLTRMASVYDAPLEELMERAGVRIDLGRPEQLPTGEEQFKRLMLAAEFIPAGMKMEYLPHFPLLHRALIQRLVANAVRHTERRVRWELRREDDDEFCPEPESMRTFAEIIGAATIAEVADPDWKEAT
mgnify:CR=1 FL=1